MTDESIKEGERQKCGCYRALHEGLNFETRDYINYHNLNCAVITAAMHDHLSCCGWHTDLGNCTQFVVHMARAELIING